MTDPARLPGEGLPADGHDDYQETTGDAGLLRRLQNLLTGRLVARFLDRLFIGCRTPAGSRSALYFHVSTPLRHA